MMNTLPFWPTDRNDSSSSSRSMRNVVDILTEAESLLMNENDFEPRPIGPAGISTMQGGSSDPSSFEGQSISNFEVMDLPLTCSAPGTSLKDGRKSFVDNWARRPSTVDLLLHNLSTPDGCGISSLDKMGVSSNNYFNEGVSTSMDASADRVNSLITDSLGAVLGDGHCPSTAQSSLTLPVNTNEGKSQWHRHFLLLQQYRRKHGHCRVPNYHHPSLKGADPELVQLASWVKRQKYQYKLKKQGKQSSLTDQRQALLESVGFVWDSHQTAWLSKYTKLKTWFHIHGHSAVPSHDPDTALSVWVKTQRRHRKLLRAGRPSPMTPERLRLLGLLDFDWDPRNLAATRGK